MYIYSNTSYLIIRTKLLGGRADMNSPISIWTTEDEGGQMIFLRSHSLEVGLLMHNPVQFLLHESLHLAPNICPEIFRNISTRRIFLTFIKYKLELTAMFFFFFLSIWHIFKLGFSLFCFAALYVFKVELVNLLKR